MAKPVKKLHSFLLDLLYHHQVLGEVLLVQEFEPGDGNAFVVEVLGLLLVNMPIDSSVVSPLKCIMVSPKYHVFHPDILLISNPI